MGQGKVGQNMMETIHTWEQKSYKRHHTHIKAVHKEYKDAYIAFYCLAVNPNAKTNDIFD